MGEPEPLDEELTRLGAWLLGGKDASRAHARDILRAKTPDEQLALLDHARLRAEPPKHRGLLARLRGEFTMEAALIHREAVYVVMLHALATQVTDPRFAPHILRVLWNYYSPESRKPDATSRFWSSRFNIPLRPTEFVLATDVGPEHPSRSTDTKAKLALFDALARTLPGMTEEQMDSLHSGQQNALLLPLAAPYRDVALTEAVLHAISRVGGVEAFVIVRRLADETPASENMRSVQAAADACRTALAKRLAQTENAETLLRASAPEPVANNLLRPAAPAPESVPSGEMLRPSDSVQNPVQ